MIPGPPLRGILSPSATSMTKMVASTSSGLNVADRLSPPLSMKRSYNIKDPMIQEKIDADVEAVSAGLMKELKMNGLVQADPELVYRMDSSLGSIPVAFNKDGSFRKNSSVADRTQFAVLGRYVRTKIEKIRSSILEGDAEVSPYELGKKNACTYCPYMTVCGFDRRLSGYEFRRLKNFSDEELWKAFDREAE